MRLYYALLPPGPSTGAVVKRYDPMIDWWQKPSVGDIWNAVWKAEAEPRNGGRGLEPTGPTAI